MQGTACVLYRYIFLVPKYPLASSLFTILLGHRNVNILICFLIHLLIIVGRGNMESYFDKKL